MVSKLELLEEYAKNNGLDPELVFEIFQVEKSNLHTSEKDHEFKQEQIREIIETWAKRK